MKQKIHIKTSIKTTIIIHIILSMALVFTPKLRGQNSIDWNAVHTKTMESITSLYSLDFTTAEKKCSETITLAPNDPRGHFFKAMLYYYRYTLVSNGDIDYKKFVSYADKVVTVCDKLLDQNEDNAKALFYKGGILGYRGLTKFNKNDMTGAFWDGKEALSSLKEAMSLDPTNPDIQMGFGLFNYLITQAPSSIKPMLQAVGLQGDKLTGLKQLENAAQNGLYCKYEAKRWLSIFYNWEEMHNRCAAQYTSLLKEFPSNSWIRLSYISALLNGLRRPEEAINQTKELEKHMRPEHKRPQSTAYVLSGIAAYNICDFDQAMQWYIKSINLQADTQHVRNACWGMGRCLEINGNRKEAWNYYVKSQHDKSEYSKPLTASDIMYIKIENYSKANKFHKIIELEPLIWEQKWEDEEKATVLYYIGRAYYETGQNKKSEKLLNQVLQSSLPKTHWLRPFTYYRMGQVYAGDGNKENAKNMFDKALEYEDYSSEEYLKKKIQKELQKLRQK